MKKLKPPVIANDGFLQQLARLLVNQARSEVEVHTENELPESQQDTPLFFKEILSKWGGPCGQSTVVSANIPPSGTRVILQDFAV